METRREITLKELETIMSTKKGPFDATSTDHYSMSIALLCNGVEFERAGDEEYLYIVLLAGNSEVQIATDIIESIFREPDGTITIEFTENLPDLEIRY